MIASEPIHDKVEILYNRLTNQRAPRLVTVDIEKRVDNRRLQHNYREHAADITDLFQSLIAKHALIKEGHGRWSWYHLPDDRPSDLVTAMQSDSHSLGNEDQSLGNDAHSLGNGNQSLGNEQQLLQIANPARLKKRLPLQDMRNIILELCSGRWLSRIQISELVNRNSEDLRKRLINPMVSDKLLRLRYPETPNRTDQAYQTINDSDFDIK